LGAIRAAGAPAVPELIKSLDSSDDMIRNSALFALGRIGPAAMAAEPVLEKMSKSEDPFVRMGSLWALVYVEPNDAGTIARAVPELIAGLSDERDPFRYEMAQTLGTLGAAAKSALPKLHKLAEEDVSPAVRSAAAHSIKQIEGK
jgi:HEAT repeat protein